MLRRATIALLLFPSALALAQAPAGGAPDRGPPPMQGADGQRGPERGPPPDLVKLTQDLALDSNQSSAFLRLMRARDHFRQVGFWVSPFPEETTEQRTQDALRYAERLREVLTEDDWATFGQARLGNLR